MIYKNLNIKWLGHASVFIKTGSGEVIYIDPYKIADFSEMADYIFITHSHYDHCSIEDIRKIIRPDTKLICPADVQSKLRHVSDNVDAVIAEPGSNGDYENIKFWAIPSYNTNKTSHTREEDWIGYVLQIDDVLVYHAGDTDLIPEMKNLENIDIAFLPVGGTFTMNAGEAAKAAALIRPKIAVPIHWGNIVGTKQDAEVFVKLAGAEGIEPMMLEKEKAV